MHIVLVSLLSLAYGGSFLDLNTVLGQSCFSGTPTYQVTTFELSPNPPVRGQTASGTMAGTLTQTETLDGFDLSVTISGIPILSQSYPFTSISGNTATADLSLTLPGISPPGNYVVQAKVKSASGEYLSCWEYDFSL